MQKTARKNPNNSRNESILKIGRHGKAIAHAKSSVWVKNENSKKHIKIHFTNYLELLYANPPPKRHEIFEKWEHFENRPSCKGYSPCKILTLGQKLKFQKTCQNPFYNSFFFLIFDPNRQFCKGLYKMADFQNSLISAISVVISVVFSNGFFAQNYFNVLVKLISACFFEF